MNVKYSENITLISKAKENDNEARERLVTLNLGLVNSIAVKFLGRGVELDDLKQIALLGLMKAINSFDEKRGYAFSTYAVPLIFGEIKRCLRDDGLIRVPRTSKTLARHLLSAKEQCENNGKYGVTIGELAKMCNTTKAEAAMALESTYPIESLESSVSEDESLTLENIICDEEEGERTFNKLALKMAIEKLAPLQKKIVLLRYYRSYSQQKTAEVLGLSQVKVSREEKKIIDFLRLQM